MSREGVRVILNMLVFAAGVFVLATEPPDWVSVVLLVPIVLILWYTRPWQKPR